MNEHRSNEEREALLAEHAGDALTSDDAADVALIAGLLADPAMWDTPAAELEDSVARAVADAPPATTDQSRARRGAAPRRRRLVFAAVAAAAAIAIALGALAVLGRSTSPDYTAQLTATALAPGAHASADITHNAAGFRITLHASRLPKLPAGQFYQAWLKDASGTLVPIGTFSSSDAGITLWSGVSPREFTTLTVTIENANNDQRSSGRRVLTGNIQPG